jgi:hypothetical protein
MTGRFAVAVLIIAVSALPITLAARNTRADPADPAQATFVVPATDGYGTAECLQGGGDCGRAVADGWCEANGFSRAAMFGPQLADARSGADHGAVALTIRCER